VGAAKPSLAQGTLWRVSAGRSARQRAPKAPRAAPAQPVVVPPALLADRPGLRLWHKLDATFRLPRASASFLLASAATYDSPAAAAATHVAVALLEDKLCETAYLAEVAGLSYEVRGASPNPLSYCNPTLTGWLPQAARSKTAPRPVTVSAAGRLTRRSAACVGRLLGAWAAPGAPAARGGARRRAGVAGGPHGRGGARGGLQPEAGPADADHIFAPGEPAHPGAPLVPLSLHRFQRSCCASFDPCR
jgi:hypothetical protein